MVRFLTVYWLAAGCLFATVLPAQTNMEISGQVLDSLTRQPLPLALVYVTSDTNRVYLAFAQTDEAGRFRMTLPEGRSHLLLHARYLGYEEKALPAHPARDVAVYLSPAKNVLSEVVVRQTRPPIVQQSDTTTYDVKAFADSTEYSVEDVLKKLPGIQVHPDGQISVNGKNVEKVLIEGSDMFGRKYTLGTRNIRAGYLDKVEIIDHYQENPVLKPVNTSEAVVLNLKLRADKKTILNGTFHAGAGAGTDGDAKGKAHLNVFSISKRLKSILLSSSGNMANVTGWEELESTYGTEGTRDLKASVLQKPDLQFFSDLQNPGLPAEFVDPVRRSFSTWRSDYKIGERWDANLGISYYAHKGEQQHTQEQTFFLNDASYRLFTDRRLKLENNTAAAELYIRHFSADNARGLQLFGVWENVWRKNRSDIDEILPDQARAYSYAESETPRQASVAALFTQKVSSASVLQVQIKTGLLLQPQSLQSENEDYPSFWSPDQSNRFLWQQLKWQQRITDVTARYTLATKHLIAEIEPIYTRTASRFQNVISLSEAPGLPAISVLPDVGAPAIQSQRAGMRLRLSGQAGASVSWKILAQARRQNTRYENDLATRMQAASLHLSGTKKFKKDAELRAQYAWQQGLSPDEYFITRPFLAESYQIQQPFALLENPSGHAITLHYGKRNAFTFRSWFVNLRYQFGQQWWRSSDNFQGTLVLTSPFLSTGNQRLALSGYWDQFLPKIRTNLKLNVSYSASRGVYTAEEESFLLTHSLGRARAEASIALPAHFRLILDNEWSLSSTFRPGFPAAPGNRIHNNRSAITGMYRHGGWQLSASWHYSVFDNQAGGSARLSGWQMVAQKEVKWRQKPLTFGLRAVNLGNAAEFSVIRSSDYFLLKDSVKATAPFMILYVDYSF